MCSVHLTCVLALFVVDAKSKSSHDRMSSRSQKIKSNAVSLVLVNRSFKSVDLCNEKR